MARRPTRERIRKAALLLAGCVVLAVVVIGGSLTLELGPEDDPPNGETVVLLHGLGRTELSMALLAERIEEHGYRVVNLGYPSRDETLDALTARLDRELAKCCADRVDQVHFVTHSLGGVLVRAWLAAHSPEHRGRVVMLAPPSRGSEVADALEGSALATTFLGPTGSRLGTDPGDIPQTLGPVSAEVGILAATHSVNPVGSWLIPGDDDGKVAVTRARLAGAADFRALPATHTFIMNRRDVAAEVLTFLRTGAFSEDSSREGTPDGGG